MLKNIIFTGGGSGGHVIPAITLISALDRNKYNLYYIGGRKSIEKELTKVLEIPYYGIYNGKLRRYFSWENFTDLLKIFWGIFQALIIMLRFRKNETLLFSTGGFVSLPAVIAAWVTGKKIFIHEQTSRVGLANKISSYFATKIFISFEDSKKFFPKDKTFFSGYPLRDACFTKKIGTVNIQNIDINNLKKPIIFVTGGGNGSTLLNELIKKHLEILTKKYFIIHQVGKSFIKEYELLKNDSYLPVPFLGDEMIDVYKLATIIVSRAGAGTVCELIELQKPTIFIPLKIAQKNEQYHNAMEAQKRIGAMVITEDELHKYDLNQVIEDLLHSEIKASEVSQRKRAKDFILEEMVKL